MSYKFNDKRRQEMAAMGFLVRVVNVDRRTHEVSAIWYTYDPRSEAEREAAEQAEFEAYMAQKKASDGESLT